MKREELSHNYYDTIEALEQAVSVRNTVSVSIREDEKNGISDLISWKETAILSEYQLAD